ncbi:MAG: FAD-binding oxidoreductase [Anaerolineales bacterium]|nr:FAD-binding oxidoreductase [Anaerolineales bacterium]
MRRWNGWGDDSFQYHLPESSIPMLEEWVGPGTPPADVSLENVLKKVPDSALPSHPLVNTDPVGRVRHARGQSFPDWVAVRSGKGLSFPDGVAYPTAESEVQELVDWAIKHSISLIPYGGGTSVVGHINPLPGNRPILTVDLGRLNRLRNLDKTSQLATFDAGIRGPDLEAQLLAHGFTLGHFPQSFEYSTLGGWIATRSTGQQSYRYGKIERTFAGGRVICPKGVLNIPPFPASAAGPDLRELILGSEGRLGIVTEAIVRISPQPEEESYQALFFPNFSAGVTAVREIVQTHIPLSMLRLSTSTETATNLALAGRERLINFLEKGLGLLGKGEEKSMLMMGVSGSSKLARFAQRTAGEIARKYGAFNIGRYMGRQWHKTRFTTPYLRNTLWEMGYGVDTLETAASWVKLPGLINDIEREIRTAAQAENERIHVFTHISHVYPDGASIYTSVIFRLLPDPVKTLVFWQGMKSAASQAIVQAGGTISHQHGIGIDHAEYLPEEKGELGLAAIKTACALFDTTGIMNPGKLASGEKDLVDS